MPINLPHEAEVLEALRDFLRSGGDANSSREMVAMLAEATDRLPLRSLDVWERKIRSELTLIEDGSSQLRLWKYRKSLSSWLDLCSGDGFKRERILRAGLGPAPNAFFCLLAIRRLNDWVPQVRAAAREELPLMAEVSDAEHVAEALWHTLSHYGSWGRLEDEDRQAVADLIAIEKVSLALVAKMQRATAGPAATVLAQAGRTPVLDRWLNQLSSSAVQPAMRAKAYRWLLEGRMVWVADRKWTWTEMQWCKGRFEPVVGERRLSVSTSIPEKLRMAAEDRSSMVRKVAGEYLIRHLDELGADEVAMASRLASDASPQVAELGRFVLRRRGVDGGDANAN